MLVKKKKKETNKPSSANILIVDSVRKDPDVFLLIQKKNVKNFVKLVFGGGRRKAL